MKTEKEIEIQQEKFFHEADQLQIKESQTSEERDAIVQKIRAINVQVNLLNWVLYGTEIRRD